MHHLGVVVLGLLLIAEHPEGEAMSIGLQPASRCGRRAADELPCRRRRAGPPRRAPAPASRHAWRASSIGPGLAASTTVLPGASRRATSSPISLRPPKIAIRAHAAGPSQPHGQPRDRRAPAAKRPGRRSCCRCPRRSSGHASQPGVVGDLRVERLDEARERTLVHLGVDAVAGVHAHDARLIGAVADRRSQPARRGPPSSTPLDACAVERRAEKIGGGHHRGQTPGCHASASRIMAARPPAARTPCS